MAGSCSGCCDWGASGRRDWGQIFVREVRDLFAGDVCFDDPRLFSVLFRLRVFSFAGVGRNGGI